MITIDLFVVLVDDNSGGNGGEKDIVVFKTKGVEKNNILNANLLDCVAQWNFIVQPNKLYGC